MAVMVQDGAGAGWSGQVEGGTNMVARQAGRGQIVLRRALAARVALVVMVVLGSLIVTAPAGPALLARQSPDDARGGLIIYDGSPVATASAGQSLTVRMRASAPAALVTYALYGLSRPAFQRLAAIRCS